MGDVINRKSHGYIDVTFNKRRYKAHRLAWLYVYGWMPIGEIDHINTIRDDNRISNLREASHKENTRNVGLLKTNRSGYKGASWNPANKNWRAKIKVDGKSIHLGCYESAVRAANAYRFFAGFVHKSYFNNGRLVPCAHQ